MYQLHTIFKHGTQRTDLTIIKGPIAMAPRKTVGIEARQCFDGGGLVGRPPP